jgi:hypothetical protein
MRSRIDDAQALRLSIVATAKGGDKVASKVTRKGQATALNEQGNRSAQVANGEREVWATPQGFTSFANEAGFAFASLVEAEQAVRSGSNAEALEALEALRSHRSYRSLAFDQQFTVCDIERLNKREIGYQRFGGINLGLAGYSAEDVVQMALVWSWAAEQVALLVHTSGIEAEDADAYRHALRQRSLVDFDDARNSVDVVRWTIRTDKDGYSLISKKDTGKIVARLADRADKFDELRSLLTEQATRTEFSIGDVFRNILKVRREGMSQIKRMLEGYAPEGNFTPSIEFAASERESVEFRSSVEANLEYSLAVASAEDDFISRKFTVQDERAELIDSLRKRDLLPIEAEAVAFVTLLNEGYSLEELATEVFADVSARKFNEIQRAAQDLLRK